MTATKSDNIMDLVASYDAYVAPEELQNMTESEAPATTAYCALASLGFSMGITFQASC